MLKRKREKDESHASVPQCATQAETHPTRKRKGEGRHKRHAAICTQTAACIACPQEHAKEKKGGGEVICWQGKKENEKIIGINGGPPPCFLHLISKTVNKRRFSSQQPFLFFARQEGGVARQSGFTRHRVKRSGSFLPFLTVLKTVT
jgi:hypothetical protein